MRAPLMLTLLVTLLAGVPFFAQDCTAPGQTAVVAFSQKVALQAVTFHAGDAEHFARVRADFTTEGWKDFMKHMDGYLDGKGAPTFDSSFIPSANARVLDEKNGMIHIRIPGTLKQRNGASSATYRAALDVRAGGNPIKIARLEQIMCVGTSTGCE